MQTVRVWDIPVRLFHWLLVLAILGLFITANLGGNWMEWHKKLGFFVLGLILFRVMWGLVGNHHARFVNFVRGPATVLQYAKGLLKPDSNHTIGHNPLGAWSVLALLAVLAFQVVTGLFSNDDILLEGPYASMVSKALSDQLTSLHKLNSDLILFLIALHVAAIIFYTVYKKEKLIKAMFSGEKIINTSTGAANEAKVPEKARPYWLSWLVALVVGGLTYAVATRVFW